MSEILAVHKAKITVPKKKTGTIPMCYTCHRPTMYDETSGQYICLGCRTFNSANY